MSGRQEPSLARRTRCLRSGVRRRASPTEAAGSARRAEHQQRGAGTPPEDLQHADSMDSREPTAAARIRTASRALARSFPILSASLALLLSLPRDACAYTDPGSGALIWQVLVAGFVGALFYFRKLASWIKTKKRDKKN